jgi:hypothetical protein
MQQVAAHGQLLRQLHRRHLRLSSSLAIVMRAAVDWHVAV